MKIFLKLIVIISIFLISGCSSNSSAIKNKNQGTVHTDNPYFQDKKILVAYFSRVGNTDFPENVDAQSSASILKDDDGLIGNTQYLAELIQQNTKGDLFLISTSKKYPIDYDETVDISGEEKEEKTKLTLAQHIENPNKYDVIFIGFPNWYYGMPMAIYAFLDEYDFSNKIIIPFSTSGGSGFSNSIEEIQEYEADANVITDGFTITHGKIADLDNLTVNEWLNEIDFMNW